MTFALIGTLAVLALIDSTSFGTLLIPIWFLLAPGRVSALRVLTYLGTVATFYFGIGTALLLGLNAALGSLDGWLDNPVVVRVQLVLGVALVGWSFFIDGDPKPGSRQSGRLVRWRERAVGQSGSDGVGALVTLALGAALLEVATMLPYIAAIGTLTTSDIPTSARIATLAGYCLLMIFPALLLLVLRLFAHQLIDPVLQRIVRWFEKNGNETTAWIVGIVGFLIARDALARAPEILELFNRMN